MRTTTAKNNNKYDNCMLEGVYTVTTSVFREHTISNCTCIVTLSLKLELEKTFFEFSGLLGRKKQIRT